VVTLLFITTSQLSSDKVDPLRWSTLNTAMRVMKVWRSVLKEGMLRCITQTSNTAEILVSAELVRSPTSRQWTLTSFF